MRGRVPAATTTRSGSASARRAATWSGSVASRSRPAAKTWTPAAARASAVARPTPLRAPMTRALWMLMVVEIRRAAEIERWVSVRRAGCPGAARLAGAVRGQLTAGDRVAALRLARLRAVDETLGEHVRVRGQRVAGLEHGEAALLVAERHQRRALGAQPTDGGIDRLHPVDVECAHDGRQQRDVVADEEVAEEAAPDLHLEDSGLWPLERHVPAGAVHRFQLAARAVDLLERLVALAEGLEHQLVRPLEHLPHLVLEIEDRPAFVAVEHRRTERLERRQHDRGQRERTFRRRIDDRLGIRIGELLRSGLDCGDQVGLLLGRRVLEVLADAAEQVAWHHLPHDPAALGTQHLLDNRHGAALLRSIGDPPTARVRPASFGELRDSTGRGLRWPDAPRARRPDWP